MLHVLAEASRSLAQSLDYERTLRAVAGMALPHLGSWCVVDILEEDESMRRLAIVHPDPKKQVYARRLETGWPPDRNDPLGLPRVVVTRNSEVIRRVTDEMLVAAARNEDNLRDLRALGIGSVIVVPLIARDHVLGAITFVSADTGHQYTQADVTVAEDLAARCAMAVDNARLFARIEEARQLAARMNEQLVIAGLRQQELAEEARGANLAKAHFLAIMSHEVRTPISAIVAYIDLLDMEVGGPVTNKQKDYLARVRDSSRHLVALVDDILDFSKIQAGRLAVGCEPNRAETAMRSALSIIQPQATNVGVEVKTSGLDEDHVYMGDGNRVRQILVVLLSNALKFTDRGGNIAVTAGVARRPEERTTLEGDGPWICISVEDSGIGIGPEDTESIFEPFVQVGSGIARSPGGSGLGLAIALDLARRMNGDLIVRSALGQGSCFTLYLPCVIGPGPAE